MRLLIVSIKNVNLTVSFPTGDQTFHGTSAAIREDQFQFSKIDFNENDVFLDLGCNIGLISCFLAKRFPAIRVYGFDASPIAIDYARWNANQNDIKNVLFFNKAIGAKTCRKATQFFSDSKNKTTLIEKRLDNENRTDCYLAKKISLKHILNSPVLEINKVKFLKVDIEGGEFEVFNYIFNNCPRILNKIEFLHLEIHKLQGFGSEGLYKKVLKHFGSRLLSKY